MIAKASESDTYPQMFMKYSEEDQNTMALTQANINNIIDNYWSLWMTGESDIDADWDGYVKNVNDAGLPQILEISFKKDRLTELWDVFFTSHILYERKVII